MTSTCSIQCFDIHVSTTAKRQWTLATANQLTMYTHTRACTSMHPLTISHKKCFIMQCNGMQWNSLHKAHTHPAIFAYINTISTQHTHIIYICTSPNMQRIVKWYFCNAIGCVGLLRYNTIQCHIVAELWKKCTYANQHICFCFLCGEQQ